MSRLSPSAAMAGPVPANHPFDLRCFRDLDGRNACGHDAVGMRSVSRPEAR